MCWNCFKKYTDEPVVNEKVQAAFDLIHRRRVYEAHDGFLHIIVSDMNVDDWFFDLTDPENGFTKDYPTAKHWEQDIFNALASLTEPERATAIAMEWGYISRDGTMRSDLTL